jgi:hypothetical protein
VKGNIFHKAMTVMKVDSCWILHFLVEVADNLYAGTWQRADGFLQLNGVLMKRKKLQ